MDGTLLDLHFDNHFWLEHVPRRYAEARGISRQTAQEQLFARYQSIEGTLEWYCVDHWSRELGLDIALLKEEVEHLISVHPYVVAESIIIDPGFAVTTITTGVNTTNRRRRASSYTSVTTMSYCAIVKNGSKPGADNI